MPLARLAALLRNTRRIDLAQGHHQLFQAIEVMQRALEMTLESTIVAGLVFAHLVEDLDRRQQVVVDGLGETVEDVEHAGGERLHDRRRPGIDETLQR